MQLVARLTQLVLMTCGEHELVAPVDALERSGLFRLSLAVLCLILFFTVARQFLLLSESQLLLSG